MSNTLSDFVEDRDTALAPAQTSAASAPLKKFLLQLRVLPRLKIFTSTE